MLAYLIKKSDFSAISEILNRDLLKVIPPGPALALVTAVARNRARGSVLRTLLEGMTQDLQGSDRAWTLDTDADRYQRILELYFFQIHTRRTWLLDFTPSAFKTTSEAGVQRIRWEPRSIFYELPPTFAEGISELYQGHYFGDEPKLEQGLRKLGILPLREQIRRHFGAGDQSAHRFELREFQQTFAQLIQAAAAEGISLDSGFIALGAMLLGLYQNLESFGGPLDVRLAHQRAFAAASRLASRAP